MYTTLVENVCFIRQRTNQWSILNDSVGPCTMSHYISDDQLWECECPLTTRVGNEGHPASLQVNKMPISEMDTFGA